MENAIDAPFAVHLAGAYIIYVCCMFNTMITPSTFEGKARPVHTFVGRLGMIAGIIGFVSGAYCAWSPAREPLPPRSFSVGITIGGVAQLWLQYRGFVAIRKFKALKEKIKEKEDISLASNDNDTGEASEVDLESLRAEKDAALSRHIYNMVGLFAVGCGVPALVRLFALVGLPSTISLVVALAILVVLIRPYGNTFLRKPRSEIPPASKKNR